MPTPIKDDDKCHARILPQPQPTSHNTILGTYASLNLYNFSYSDRHVCINIMGASKQLSHFMYVCV